MLAATAVPSSHSRLRRRCQRKRATQTRPRAASPTSTPNSRSSNIIPLLSERIPAAPSSRGAGTRRRLTGRRHSAIPRPVSADRRPSPAIALLAVLVVAAALRLASAFTLGDVAQLHGDEGYYVRAARALAAGDGHPGALRPPGYPAFVAGALVLGGGSLRVARVAQIGVALLGVWAVFALVRPRFGTRAAVLSALLCALHPTLVFYSHLFWSETLVATLLLLAFLCLDRFDAGGRDRWLVGAGVALGAAVLVRDMLLFFAPVVAVWTVVAAGGAGAWRPGARRAALLLVPLLACVVPWMVRNRVVEPGAFTLSTNGWYPIAVGNLIPRDRILGMSDENRAFVRAYDALPGGELERAAFARESASARDRRAPAGLDRAQAGAQHLLPVLDREPAQALRQGALAGARLAGCRAARGAHRDRVLRAADGRSASWRCGSSRVAA